MKKYICPFGIAAMTLMCACSSDDSITQEVELDNSMKTLIEFNMTDNTASTSVGVEGSTRAGFSSNTDMVIKMVAEKVDLNSGPNATGSEKRYTITKATAGIQQQLGTTEYFYSPVTFDHATTQQRYWDDAYGRETRLSAFAVAVADKTANTKIQTISTSATWNDNNDALTWPITWSISTNQTTTTIADEDLVYSNNIKKEGENGVLEYDFTTSAYKSVNDLTDGRMGFQLKSSTETAGPGKFNGGNLNFTHALSRITVNIKLGTGFTQSEHFDNSKAQLFNMYTSGSLDVASGVFTPNTTSAIVMAPISPATTGANATYQAQVVPGYLIAKAGQSNAEQNMLQFKVYEGTAESPTSQNIYYVTNKSVHTALDIADNTSNLDKDENDNIKMEQGKHYILNITVSKTGIESMTATLVNWKEVTGSHTQNNAYISFDGAFAQYSPYTRVDNFSLYRLNDPSSTLSTDGSYKAWNWKTGWSSAPNYRTDPTGGSGNSKWGTTWFFEDNKAFYHFRTVGKKETAEETYEHRTIHTDATNGDYFDIESGVDDGRYYWGAPMISGKDLKYSTTYGYDNLDGTTDANHHIHYAIGATNSNIHITMVHMLSKIRVVLKTPSQEQGGVKLKDGDSITTIKITKVFTKGKVNMGNGLVTAGKNSEATQPSRTYVSMTAPSDYFKDGTTLETQEFTYYCVPQQLVDNNGTPGDNTDDIYVGLEIQTPDNNIYYVVQKLTDIIGTVAEGSNSTHVSGQAIRWWYPNHSYLYTITLKKTGIEKITCTLTDWTEVTGVNQDITIED